MAIISYSFKNKNTFITHPLIGCFYCLRTFTQNDIVEWVDVDETALCPRCGIDSVVALSDIEDLSCLKEENTKKFGVLSKR